MTARPVRRPARRTAVAAACAAALAAPLAAQAATDHHAAPGKSAHAARAARSVSAFDKQFITAITQRSKADLIGGGIALKRSPSALGRDTGAASVSIAGAVRTNVAGLAKSLGVIPPTTTTPSQHWSLHQLGVLMGVEFDRQYAQLLIAHQVESIKDAQLELSSGANPRIKAFAKSLLPTLRSQLAMANRLARNPG